jgi:site-specific recombinase XerD
MTLTLGQAVRSFFEDHLPVQKGLRPTSVQSYRDTVRLFLIFVSTDLHRPITRLRMQDLTMAQALAFLKHLEQKRGNHIRTRNQRLAALRTFFTYLATRVPEMLHTAHQVMAIPTKRVPPPETQFLEREEMISLLRSLPREGRHAQRDRTLFAVLYNTGARAQEVADLRIEHLDLGPQPSARLHGKGDKWRTCPLWAETARHLRMLLSQTSPSTPTSGPVFCSSPARALTRFGIYKIVRKHGAYLDRVGDQPRRVTPHLFRHTAAVHLLEAGVEVNVIRAWLGHVSLETTNHYAQLTLRSKLAAMETMELPSDTSAGLRRGSGWREDQKLLAWLDAL